MPRRILLTLLAGIPIFSCAFAGEDAKNAQAAGNARFFAKKTGSIEIVALLDAQGVRQGAAALLVGAGKEDLERAKAPDGLKISTNAFLVKFGGKTYLFDAGLPPGNATGILPALAEAGCAPGDIDRIVITHFHGDHVGGLLKDGKPVYPNAELAVPRVEVDKWSAPGTDFLIAYGPRVKAFEYDAEVYPGIVAVAAPGHTPGHTVFRVVSGDDELLVIGDVVHLGGVQLPNPDVAVTYDADPSRAVASRRRIFGMAAEKGCPVASMHLPFPGLGVLSGKGDGYAFTALPPN